jgi:hypothetical protein
MALTGRAGLLALLGVLPVAAWPADGLDVPWRRVVLALVLVDVPLAAPAPLACPVAGDTARLGETARSILRCVNPAPAACAGVLRDAWVPSAGARPRTATGRRGPRRARRGSPSTLRPTRRGDRLHRPVTVRCSARWGWPAGRLGTMRAVAVRVLPPFASRKHLPSGWPGCASSTAAQAVGPGARAPSSTRCASTCPATTSAPSTGAPPPGLRGRGAHLAARARPPRRDRAGHLPHRAGRVGDVPRLDAPWTPPCCSPRWPVSGPGDRVDLLALRRGTSGPTSCRRLRTASPRCSPTTT